MAYQSVPCYPYQVRWQVGGNGCRGNIRYPSRFRVQVRVFHISSSDSGFPDVTLIGPCAHRDPFLFDKCIGWHPSSFTEQVIYQSVPHEWLWTDDVYKSSRVQSHPALVFAFEMESKAALKMESL